MRKTAAVILCAAMALQGVGFSAMANATDFYEGFDECITNTTTVEGISVSGKNTHVESDGKNKELFFSSTGKEAYMTFDVNKSSEELIFSADITIDGEMSYGYVCDSVGGTKYIKFEKNGEIKSHDDKKTASYTQGEKINAAVVLHGKRSTYDVYINGKSVLSDWYTGATIPETVTGIKYVFRNSGENPLNIKIDNIKVYNAEKPDFSAVKSVYNEETTQFTPETENESVGNSVFANRTFEETNMDEFAYLSPSPKTNKIYIEKDKVTGNHYVKIERKTPSDAFFEISGMSGKYSRMVIEFDIKRTEKMGGAVGAKDLSGQFQYLLILSQSGTMTVANKMLPNLDKNKWVNLAFVCNFESQTFDVYYNHKLMYERVDMSNAAAGNPNILRFHSWEGQGSLMFDNIAVYEGKEIKSDLNTDKMSQSTVFFPDNDAEKLIGNKTAISLKANTIYTGGKKEKADIFTENGRTMLPIRLVAESMGLDVKWDNGKITVGNNAEMNIGSKIISADGKKIETDTAPMLKDDTAYLPIRVLCENVLGKKVFYDDRGLVVISDSEFNPSAADIWHIFNYLTYDRYSDSELIDLFNKNNNNVHPRIIISPSDLERIRGYAENDTNVKAWSKSLIQEANTMLKKEPMKYALNNTENALLDVSREVLQRMEKLGYAYLITNDEKYAERAWEELNSAGKFKDWCPAHYLDVAEMNAAFAIGYDWFYDYWTEEQKEFIANAIIEKCLKDAKSIYLGQTSAWWPNVEENNWNAVCNGGILMGAAAIFDREPELCAFIINSALRGLETFEQGFYPSGAWPEGFGYFCYACEYMFLSYPSLISTFGTDFGLFNAPGLDKSPEYVVAVNGSVSNNNYHDMGAGTLNLPAELMWLGRSYNNLDVMGVRINAILGYGWQGTLFDILFYDDKAAGNNLKMNLDSYFPNTELVSMREAYGSKPATFLSFHGGETFPNHGHSDGGTFVLDMLGENFACDLGSDSYALPHYWERTRPYYRQRAEGHNTLVINPDTSAGQDDGNAVVTKLESKEKGAISVLDLTPTYQSKVTDYKRGYMLTDDRRNVVIRDELSFKKSGENEVYWFMHTQGDIEIKDESTAVITKNGKSIMLKFITDAGEAELSKMDAQPLKTSPKSDPGEYNRDAYKKVALHIKAENSLYIQVKIMPVNAPEAEDEIEDLPISEWTVPDGRAVALPELTDISADGKTIRGFDGKNENYTLSLMSKDKPEITAAASENVAYEFENNEENTVIRVYYKDNPKMYRIYTIKYHMLPEAQGTNGMKRLNVANVFASEVAQADNPETNVIDNDISTRWAAEGNGQWIALEYDKPETFNSVGVAIMNGTERVAPFDILISDDGENWEQIYTGKTSGKTNEIELYDVGSVTAKYIKLMCHGNSVNKWNSITEFGAYRKN